MSDQPSVKPGPDSKFQLEQPPPHAEGKVPPTQEQPPPVQLRFASHLLPQEPQLLLSVAGLIQVPQHLPVEHWISLLQAAVALLILLVH